LKHFLIDSEGVYISKMIKVGHILDKFYVHTEDNILFVLNSFGEIEGEWVLALNKPKKWDVYFN
jgi:hypothetical protein